MYPPPINATVLLTITIPNSNTLVTLIANPGAGLAIRLVAVIATGWWNIPQTTGHLHQVQEISGAFNLFDLGGFGPSTMQHKIPGPGYQMPVNSGIRMNSLATAVAVGIPTFRYTAWYYIDPVT